MANVARARGGSSTAHRGALVTPTDLPSTSAREGRHLPFDGSIGRRWRAKLTSIGEPTPDAWTLSALRTTWYRSKHWRPWDVGQLGIRKGSRG
jgi:hypothetical protein